MTSLVVDRPRHAFWETFWRNHSGGQGPFLGGYPPSVRGFVVNNLRKHLPDRSGRIIDLGAGADLWLSRQIKQTLPNCRLTALDILPANDLTVNDPGIKYIQASACATGLPAASFDAAVSTFTLDYLGEERPRALGEIGRLLKPSGIALLTLHHQRSYLAPGLRFETAMLAECQREMSGLLASARFRERFAGLPTTNIVLPELRNMIIRFGQRGTPDPSDAELKLLIREEIAQLEANMGFWSAMVRNVFASAGQVRSFFRGCGLSPEVVTTLDYRSYLLGFGVVARPVNK